MNYVALQQRVEVVPEHVLTVASMLAVHGVALSLEILLEDNLVETLVDSLALTVLVEAFDNADESMDKKGPAAEAAGTRNPSSLDPYVAT